MNKEKWLPPKGEVYIKGFDKCIDTIKDYMRCRNISSTELESFLEDKRKKEISTILKDISDKELEIIKKIRKGEILNV